MGFMKELKLYMIDWNDVLCFIVQIFCLLAFFIGFEMAIYAIMFVNGANVFIPSYKRKYLAFKEVIFE